MYGRILPTLLAIFLFGCDNNNAASSPDVDTTHKCDEYAAHPNDPGKWAVGVSEEELIPGPAIKFCAEAVKESTGTVRFQFQLGRALLAGQQYDQAIEYLAAAAEQDYAPAYAYLADVYRSGLLGEKDLETAEAYYDIAIAGGFTPAEEAKLGLYGGDEVDNESSNDHGSDQDSYYQPPSKPMAMQKHLNPEELSNGGLLLALYDGEFEAANKLDVFLVNKYLAALNNYFSSTYNMHDESCSAYANPHLTKVILKRTLSGMGVGMDLSPEERGLNSLTLIAKMMKGMREDGGSSLHNRMMDIDVAEKSATKDGVFLARNYGCESSVFKRLYRNIEAFAYGRNPRHMSGLAGFRAKCQVNAKDRGSTGREAVEICNCFSNKFSIKHVSDQDIEWITKNYDQGRNFNSIISKYDGLKQEIAVCLLH